MRVLLDLLDPQPRLDQAVQHVTEGLDAFLFLGFELPDACGWKPRLVAHDDELDTAALEELCCLYSGVAACAGDEHGLDI